MGFADVPTIILSGLSEVQKRALRIADNKIALNAGWDLEILQQELGELASIDLDIDATLTGFTTGEIDVILTTTAEDPDDEVIPSVPTTPRTKPGDIWILGEHGVGCGDGRMPNFCSGSLAAECVSMRLSSILPTMCGLGDMRWPPEAIASLQWPEAR
jgi:hypothetical protein